MTFIKKTCCVIAKSYENHGKKHVLGVFQSGFNYHLKYLKNVHLCKKSPHKSGDFLYAQKKRIYERLSIGSNR